MAIKLGKLVTYGEVNTPMKSDVPLITWLHEVTWKTKILSSSGRYMTTKPWRVLTYGKTKPIVKLHGSDNMIARGHVSDRKLNISSSRRPIPAYLAGCWSMVTGSHPWSHMALWLCKLIRSYEKYTTYYLQFCKAYGSWSSSIYKTKWPLNQVVTWQNKNSKLEIALFAITKRYNRNILVGNIFFFNHIVLIKNWETLSSDPTTFLKLENNFFFMMHNCTKLEFEKIFMKWSYIS